MKDTIDSSGGDFFDVDIFVRGMDGDDWLAWGGNGRNDGGGRSDLFFDSAFFFERIGFLEGFDGRSSGNGGSELRWFGWKRRSADSFERK